MLPPALAETLVSIALSDISPSPYNTRRIFDPVKLQELADSIRARGVVEPLIVRTFEGSPPYELVAGERRYRAAQMAGLTAVPCIVREVGQIELLDLQLIENVQREDLHPLEEARGYQQRKDAGASIDELAKITGKNRTHVSRRLQLLNLISEAQDVFLRSGMLPKHALMIARLPESEQPKAFLYLMTGRDYEKPVAKLIVAMKTSRELLVWMTAFTLYRDAYVQQYHESSVKDDLHQAAARYGVNAQALRKEVDAVWAEKRAKRAGAARKKQSKPKKTDRS
jgi:ParB/RepB/Spo0J family partition protein